MPSFQPEKGERSEAFHDGGTDDGDRKIFAASGENGFAEAFGEGVGVGPAEMLGAADADTGEAIASPADAVAAEDAVEFFLFFGGDFRGVDSTTEGLAF